MSAVQNDARAPAPAPAENRNFGYFQTCPFFTQNFRGSPKRKRVPLRIGENRLPLSLTKLVDAIKKRYQFTVHQTTVPSRNRSWNQCIQLLAWCCIGQIH
jgi:hypothetical protein